MARYGRSGEDLSGTKKTQPFQYFAGLSEVCTCLRICPRVDGSSMPKHRKQPRGITSFQLAAADSDKLRVQLDDGSHVDRRATGIEINIMPVDYLTKLVATAKGQDDIQRELKRRSKEATCIRHFAPCSLARLLARLLVCRSNRTNKLFL